MDDMSESTKLGELIPRMTQLAGIPSADVIGNVLVNHLTRHGRLTWADLADMNRREIALVPRIGPVQLHKIVSAIERLVGDLPEDAHLEMGGGDLASMSARHRSVVAAVINLASWYVADGRVGSLLDMLRFAELIDDPGLPAEALAALTDTDVAELADEELVRRHDPRYAALQLISEFDDRESATLERVLDFDGSARTLESIGVELGVTRERVRQIEKIAKVKLETALSQPAYRSIGVAAKRFRLRFGSAVPEADLLSEFEQSPPGILDRLILHVAGPYVLRNGWFSIREVTPLTDLVRNSFLAVATRGVASTDELRAALDEHDVRLERVDRLLEAVGLRRFDEQVVDWTGSLGEKSALVLRVHGTPMRLDELVEQVRPNNPRSLGAQLNSTSGILRTGLKRYGLVEWDLDAFEGTAGEMCRHLQSGPRQVADLARELSEEFGISEASVKMLAGRHPQFLLEGSAVQIRPADQPYLPQSSLENSRGCFLVDGVWALKIVVDHDAIRGSGRQIPEAFALHLGLQPLEKSKVESPVGPISLGWGQHPSIGSVRSLVIETGAKQGDLMFVKRIRPSAVDVKLVAAADERGTEELLRSAIGAGTEDSLEQVLADALGLRGTVNHSFAEERAALAARREDDLIRLLDKYLDQLAATEELTEVDESSTEGPRRGLW
jgi:hypothetical protein